MIRGRFADARSHGEIVNWGPVFDERFHLSVPTRGANCAPLAAPPPPWSKVIDHALVRGIQPRTRFLGTKNIGEKKASKECIKLAMVKDLERSCLR